MFCFVAEKRKIFEMKRKQHYNEYYAVKLARKLMEDDDEDEDECEEDENNESAGKDGVSTNDEKDTSMEEVVEDNNECSGSQCEKMAVGEEQETSKLGS